MRVRFIGSGEPDENRVCEIFGLSFPIDEWVEVPEEVHDRLFGNWTFEREVHPLDHDADGRKGGSLPGPRKRGRPRKNP